MDCRGGAKDSSGLRDLFLTQEDGGSVAVLVILNVEGGGAPFLLCSHGSAGSLGIYHQSIQISCVFWSTDMSRYSV